MYSTYLLVVFICSLAIVHGQDATVSGVATEQLDSCSGSLSFSVINPDVQNLPNNGCDLDLVFMIDTSGSIRDSNVFVDNFQLILDFVKNIIELFSIGLKESLVGVILFSDDATLHFNVKTHTDINTLLAAICNLPYRGSTTNTAAALELLLNSAQDGTMELRSGHPHIAVLITDGMANERAAETIPMAERVRESNIFQSIYAVGITPLVNLNELRDITGNPSHVLETPSFAALSELQGILSQTLCDTTMATSDPHFITPLVSDDKLCYSIQGYPGLVFNLIYSHDYIINALFAGSDDGGKNRTQIAKLAVIPRSNTSNTLIFDSVKQEVVLVSQKHHIPAKIIDKLTVDEIDRVSVKFIGGVTNQTGNQLVHVDYAKPFATLDVSFNDSHLDVDWNMTCNNDTNKIHGLVGQLMVKGLSVDPIKRILTYPDSHDPVTVELDDVMTGKTCWKAINPGHQGEGLIEGSVLDYMVSTLLEDDFKLEKPL